LSLKYAPEVAKLRK